MDAAAAARNASAALALSAMLFVSQVPRSPAPVVPCERPRELWARQAHTRAVACVAAEPPRGELRGPVRRLFGLPLDPNRADAASLQTLPGIGPARARAIVEEREKQPFRSLADLARVRGIGPRIVASLAPWAAVEPLQENR